MFFKLLRDKVNFFVASLVFSGISSALATSGSRSSNDQKANGWNSDSAMVPEDVLLLVLAFIFVTLLVLLGTSLTGSFWLFVVSCCDTAASDSRNLPNRYIFRQE
ncbi:unnamed protein product, partial [Nesidiocoris tenuis]